MDNTLFTRRGFLGTSAVAAATTISNAGYAQQKKNDLQVFFDDAEITDQYDKKFKPSLLFANKPVIFIFGYNHCKFCEGLNGKPGIMDSVAAMQQELMRQNKEIPIVLVDVLPSFDKEKSKEHVASHYSHGIRQFGTEQIVQTIEAGENAYDAGKRKEPSSRLFHIAYPPNEQWAENLQTTKMQLLQNPNDHNSHALDAVLFINGKKQDPMLVIPEKGKTLKDYKDHGAALANKISSQLGKIRQ